MKKISKNTSLKELAAIVYVHLKEWGIEAVLTGGGVVSIYTENKYESFDLDFVTHSSLKEVETALKELGFKRERGRQFIHTHSDYFLDFVAPPLSIGDEPITQWNELKTPKGPLALITPTDCVKDRLAAYYHWKDLQSLDQAVGVAKKCKINLNNIRKWSEKKGMLQKYKIFRKKLNK